MLPWVTRQAADSPHARNMEWSGDDCRFKKGVMKSDVISYPETHKGGLSPLVSLKKEISDGVKSYTEICA